MQCTQSSSNMLDMCGQNFQQSTKYPRAQYKPSHVSMIQWASLCDMCTVLFVTVSVCRHVCHAKIGSSFIILCYKDTCRKSYAMRPLSDRKSCETHLIAHFQWGFLRFHFEFFHSFFCVEFTYEFLDTYFKRAIMGEFLISVTLTFANAYTLISAVFSLTLISDGPSL